VPFSRVVVPHDSPSSNPITKIDITTALQYSQANGYPPLLSFMRQFTRENLHPNVPYTGGPEVILTTGALDGLSKALECLSNPWNKGHDWVCDREGLLCEEFTFMNAIQVVEPRGLQIVPVKVDSEGMLPSGLGGLRDILDNWDTRKGKRPHLMYTIT
jgi:DNA-binding transcriptional MocR family regulator